jgi:drug/metabolite transporter (DMT)-like permease
LSRRASGILLLLVSAASFGAMPVFATFAYRDGAGVSTLLFLRFVAATTILAVLCLAMRVPFPRGRTLGVLVLMGSVTYVGQSFTYFMGLSMAPAGLVALMLYLYPALVALLAFLFLKQRLTLGKAMALAMAMGGAFLALGPVGGGNVGGMVFGVLSAVFYAVYVIVGTVALRQANPFAASTVVVASACAVYTGLAALGGLQLPQSGAGWFWIGMVAVISTVVSISTFLAGLERVGPVDASTASAVEPAVAVLLGASILGEQLLPIQLVGGGLILLAAIALVRLRDPSAA